MSHEESRGRAPAGSGMPRRFERWIGALGVGGLLTTAVAITLDIRILVAAGAVLMGLAGAVSMIESHRTGTIRANGRIFRRADDPRWFRIQLGFWWALLVLFTTGGVLCGLGVIGRC